MERFLSVFYAWRGWLWAFWGLLVLWGANCPGFLGLSLGVALLLWGAWWRKAARETIGEHSRGDAWASPVLLQTGAYERCRHPLYTSNALIALGFVGFANVSGPILVAAIMGVVCMSYVLMSAEDRYLAKLWGRDWVEWAQRVPRIPRWKWDAWFPMRELGDLGSWGRWILRDRWTLFWWLIGMLALGVRGVWGLESCQWQGIWEAWL